MASDLRQRGIDLANEATRLDNAQKYAEAKQSYIQACEYIVTYLKYEKNNVIKTQMEARLKEYMDRAEALKKHLNGESQDGKKAAAGGGGESKDDDDDDDAEDTTPLTEEELAKAEAEMNAELDKLIGMESVKESMRQVCKQLSFDIKRRQSGLEVMDSIRHMVFTGNPGVGKTTISKLIGRLFYQLRVSSKDQVVEVQKGDLVAGYVNQTSIKTREKIKQARGGILFVDEAYQLTQSLQRGQSDFSGEAIDEIMKVMNESGRKAVTFIFAGYRKEMEQFEQYNAGLESRIKYRFHFEDYTVKDLVRICELKMEKKFHYKFTEDARKQLPMLIEKGCPPSLIANANGRLVDNMIQYASDELNNRLTVDAEGDALITMNTSDFANAIARFKKRPPTKEMKDPLLVGGKEVETQLQQWDLQQYSELFVRAGYRQLFDLLELKTEKDIRALGVTKTGDVSRALTLVQRLEQQHREMSLQMDAMYIDPDTVDMRTWLEKRGLGEHTRTFEKHAIDFEVLGDITYEDLTEMGLTAIGPRRKVYRAITQWREDRDIKKAEVIRHRMALPSLPGPGGVAPAGVPPPIS